MSNVGGKTLSKATSKLGIEGYFDFLVSRNDVVNPKPSPEGIHMALERMGEKRGNSVFLGDSLDDVHAARNAGLRVIIIAEGKTRGPRFWLQNRTISFRVMKSFFVTCSGWVGNID